MSRSKGILVCIAILLISIPLIVLLNINSGSSSLPRIDGARVLVIIGPGFDGVEYFEVVDVLEDQGATVLTASYEKEPLQEHWGSRKVTPNLTLTEVEVDVPELIAFFIPGGLSPENLLKDARNETLINLVKEANDKYLILSAICHGPWVLANASVVEGRNGTGHEEVAPYWIAAGGIWTFPTMVERCANFLTARYEALEQFKEDLVSFIAERVHKVEVGAATYYVYTWSNSTVSNFAFDQSERTISFNVTGSSSTVGFCNVTIPKELLDSPFNVLVDDNSVDYTLNQNGTHSFLYFTYTHSTHKVEIVGTGIKFSLVTLYMVHLEVNANFSEGSKLIVMFYSYSSAHQANTTVWTDVTLSNVTLSVDVPHPLGLPVEKTTLVLTDDLGAILQTLTSFLVRRFHLMVRLTRLDTLWIAQPGTRTAIFKEIVDIDGQWPYAPP